MKTLLLSNYLKNEYNSSILCSAWGIKHPSLADFQCVILDMKLDTNIDSEYLKVQYKGYSFYRLFDDVIRLLRAGGTLICLNYYTFINVPINFSGTKVLNQIQQHRQSDYSYEHKFINYEETSYDWLDLGFLQCTQLDRINIMPGQQIKSISKLDIIKRYFSYVREYHKIIQGVKRESGAGLGLISWNFRLDPTYEHHSNTQDQVEVLAVTEVTDEPIAVAIKYMHFPGTLVFLPTYDLSDAEGLGRDEAISAISNRLASIGEYYYEVSQQDFGVLLESPPWLLECRAARAKETEKELETLEKKKTTLVAERGKYDRTLILINGYGEPFEQIVAEIFGKEWFGFDLEKTEKGHAIDLFVRNTMTDQLLAVQATGVVGKFTQRDKHFGALLGYLPEHEEKIVSGQNERIVLVVNTYRDTPLENRTDSEDVSMQVQNLVKKNGMCLIRSCDLYTLWKRWAESPGELSTDEIFRQLFDCEGIWQPK